MILNTKKIVDSSNTQKIFFGKYSGFQRFDQYRYPFAKNIEEKMRQSFWNPSEIGLNADRVKFPDLPQHAQDILTRNLLFQTLMDSAQARGLSEVLSSMCTDPTWEMVLSTQSYFERIHSLSYSHILREVFPDATAVFDQIETFSEITSRINKEIQAYDNIGTWDDGVSTASTEIKKQEILELITRIYALESLKFYVSFLVTYLINEGYGNKIQGITRIIKLINFDEDQHVSVFAGLISILKKNKKEGFQDLFTSGWFGKRAREIFAEVAMDELSWGDYLLSIGNVPSLTKGVLKEFIEYFADKRLGQLGVDQLFHAKKTDTVTWFENYKDIDNSAVKMQEAEGLAYNIGILTNDIEDGIMEVKRG